MGFTYLPASRGGRDPEAPRGGPWGRRMGPWPERPCLLGRDVPEFREGRGDQRPPHSAPIVSGLTSPRSLPGGALSLQVVRSKLGLYLRSLPVSDPGPCQPPCPGRTSPGCVCGQQVHTRPPRPAVRESGGDGSGSSRELLFLPPDGRGCGPEAQGPGPTWSLLLGIAHLLWPRSQSNRPVAASSSLPTGLRALAGWEPLGISHPWSPGPGSTGQPLSQRME